MKKILILCTFMCFNQVISQEKFEIKKIGFSMNSPNGWHVMKDEETLKNLEQYDLTDEQLDVLLKTNTKQLVTYTKYDPKKLQESFQPLKLEQWKLEVKLLKVLQKKFNYLQKMR